MAQNVRGADKSASILAYFDALARSEGNAVKNRSDGYLIVESGTTVVTKQRGKALFNTGFSEHNNLHLHPEEATCLAHRGVLDIRLADNSSSAASLSSLAHRGVLDIRLADNSSSAASTSSLSLHELNDQLSVCVPRECREVYCFLKDRKFIPRRVRRPAVSTATHVSIAYAVHAPGKKSDPPLFHAVVFRMSDVMPSLDLLLSLTPTRSPEVPSHPHNDDSALPVDIPIKLFACDGEGGVIPLECLVPAFPTLVHPPDI
ncbi:hypothetical protein DYB30_010556 [Aphanomyces astaci]|uniref:tRNA-splicing endonuclease subunit Sen54 N-terminal domain-containing protein n=1 Tax=Aphanomyces astaci TaxID=112090 RepID=A0A397DFT6_APHAT|nr:hypothetical protein DYB30_010556 [Aphanomyces astaci]